MDKKESQKRVEILIKETLTSRDLKKGKVSALNLKSGKLRIMKAEGDRRVYKFFSEVDVALKLDSDEITIYYDDYLMTVNLDVLLDIIKSIRSVLDKISQLGLPLPDEIRTEAEKVLTKFREAVGTR